MKFILLLAISVMASDTTMTGPMCEYKTKVADGYEVFGCTDRCRGKNFICISDASDLTHCDTVQPLFKDTTWYAPCKSFQDSADDIFLDTLITSNKNKIIKKPKPKGTK